MLVWLLGWLVAAAPTPLLHETFDAPGGGWLVDEFSRFEGGCYVIDARGAGGFYRWLEQPAGLGDFDLTVEVEKDRGDNYGPIYGVLFRIQDGWQNSYFLGVNGARSYYFGKFVAGSPVLLKQAVSDQLRGGGARNTLGVRAQGGLLELSINGQEVARLQDETFQKPGRIGLFAEAPAMVRFDNLQVLPAAGGPTGPAPPTGTRTLYLDPFERPSGWAEDEFRELANGEYHLHNNGEQASFLSWQPSTAGLTDFVATIDVRQRVASPNQLFGLCWRVVDGTHFAFLLINPDGTYYAGVRNGDDIQVQANGRQPAIRAGDEPNTLSVSAERKTYRLLINGVATAAFEDPVLTAGCLGVYLEGPGHVSFDNLQVTDLPRDAPPPLGGHESPLAWPAGEVVYHEPLSANIGQQAWLIDAQHRFEQGGYVVDAPAEGSETLVAQPTVNLTDGVFEVNARATAGPVASSFGLVFRADPTGQRYYYFLLNSAGTYFVGVCVDGVFGTLDSGPVAELRGGAAGNNLQVRAQGDTLRYAVNGRELGQIKDARLTTGGVGLHVEQGVTACFRDLRVRPLAGAEGTQ
ncbi:MAG: DUF1080 domain-containing protein [Rubrivivax sp.]|nr:DUF1080 domain-containing protein [Rubrivivax sp.]